MTSTLEKQLPRIILYILSTLTVVLGVISYMGPPAIFPDPSWGFQVMRSMERGGGFNLLIGPSAEDVSKNAAEFISWWSPGQYLAPYLFKTLFHTNTAQAAVITVTACQLLGIAGFYNLFKKVGFSRLIAAISVAVIVCQQYFYIPYSFYNGGEVLLFAYAGWFLYGCLSFRKINVGMLLFILLSGWAGFFCKSSMMWIYASGLLCLWINLSYYEKNWWQWIRNGIWMAPPAILSVAAIYVFYLSKGQTPASTHAGIRLAWETFGFPLASPLLSGFSVDELTHGLIYHPDGPMFSLPVTLIIIWALAILSILVVVKLIRTIPQRHYTILIAVFYVVSVLFFSYAFLRQLAISYEGRHFRIVGLLIIPGIVYLLSNTKVLYRAAFGLMIVFILAFSLNKLKDEYAYNKEESAHGTSGLTQGFIDQPTLNYIMQLDKQQRNATFVFVSADLGLEINNNRIITIEPIGHDVKIDYYDYLHEGHAGPLYIVLPSDYEEQGRDKFIMKCFPGYKNFKTTALTEDYTIYSAQ
ncbi:hypothetical protein [Mucilaginibacter lacusdianchii]|uniref:hypothetical protein n=1 Tax=Mucilaginibacter lacusdianchii TaxID=2684211 RepID=UPI00131A8A55|nr:hypothetical protein [Mucilaginibacter sp. JXJ CY 39]